MTKPRPDTVLLNVCAIPPASVAERAVLLSRDVGDQALFTLGGDKFAHMTLYMARFDAAAVRAVLDAVSPVVDAASPVHCAHSGYLLTEGRYLEVSYRRSPELLALHEALIAAVAPLRADPGRPHEESYFAPYDDEQRRNAVETGYDLAHHRFRPHVTLTRYAEQAVPAAFPALPSVALSFDLGEVCVYEADDNGAVYKRLSSSVAGSGTRP